MKGNKAHTATVRRICERYGGISNNSHGVDVVAGDFLIEVETTPTIEAGIRRLSAFTGRRFIAVTNKESLVDAIRLTEGTGVGVMDPHGNIIKQPDAVGPGPGPSAPTDTAP